MEHYHKSSGSQEARKHLPYDPLTARCPKCRAAQGRRCISARHKLLHHPHVERVEVAAGEYRAAVRLQILDRTRRHSFTPALSPRGMAQVGVG